MRAEVVKSDWRSCSRTAPRGATDGAARSTMALFGARPTVGWLTVWLAPPRAAGEAAGHDRPLRDGIDLAVGAAQRGEHQDAALQIGCSRRSRRRWYRCAIPGCAKAGSVAVTITAAVLVTRIAVGGHRDAHALQQVGEALGREHRLAAVAGAGQADHQAVTDQLVFANAFDRDQVLQPGRRGRGRGAQQSRAAGRLGVFIIRTAAVRGAAR